MSTENTNLLVPIHLDAICVSSNANNEDNKSGFAQSTLQNLIDLPQHNISPQTAALSHQFHSQPFTKDTFDPGVHLHWSLPDALTHGKHVFQFTDDAYTEMRCLGISEDVIDQLKGGDIDSEELFENEVELVELLTYILDEDYIAAYQGLILEASGRFVFPEVPNRWLLTRIVNDSDGDNPKLKSWIVESDFLTTQLSDLTNQTMVPSPNGLSDPEKPYRYMGRAKQVDEEWNEDNSAKRYPNLTALGYGEISFAAYYPNCATVFGFYDDLSDLCDYDYTAEENCLSYSVIGWHNEKSNDPLLQDKDVEDILANMAWGLVEYDFNYLERTVYHAMLHKVQWNSEYTASDYHPDHKEAIEIAIGNSSGEALAAYLGQHSATIGNENEGHKGLAETLIEALQLDLLDEIHLAEGDFEQLEHAVHEKSFRAHPGGSEWVIRKKPSTPEGKGKQAKKFDQSAHDGDFNPPILAPEIADELSKINKNQQAYDKLQFETREKRWQLFADWHRYMAMMYPEHTIDDFLRDNQHYLIDALLELVKDGLKKLKKVFSQLASDAESIIEDASALRQKTSKHYEISRVAAPRFWQPNDPTLLLVGTDVNPSQRYGSDTSFGEDGLLACRLTNQVISTIEDEESISDNLDPQSLLPAIELPEGLDKSLLDKLLYEAILIDSLLIKKTESLEQSDIESGTLPALLAINKWGNAEHTGSNPWHPLFLHWEMITSVPNATTPEKFVQKNATLSPQALDLNYTDNNIQAPLDKSHPYQGIALLSGHPGKILTSQLEKLIPDGIDDELKTKLRRLPMMSQIIRGFNDSLLMRAQQNQFQIENPYLPKHKASHHHHNPHIWEEVQTTVGRMNIAAPISEARFSPIRSGLGKLEKLWLVDAFGQYKAFEGSNFPKLKVPSTMRIPSGLEVPAEFSFLPRIVQPCRLMMRWLSAENHELFTNSHPNTSPICGWVLPNHLDHSLMIYDCEGKALGALLANVTINNRWHPAPSISPPPDLSEGNQCLYEMVEYLKKLDDEAFLDYFKSIEQVLLTIEPPSYREHNALSVLMGRPLALAQLKLTLELKGSTAVDQNFETLFDLHDENTPKESWRTSNNFTEVLLPIRLGDVAVERDGLVCTFSLDDHNDINAHHLEVNADGEHISTDDNNNWLNLSTKSKKNNLLVPVLLDPRASIHATTGFLPVQSITIPPEFYTDILHKMAFTFLVNPLLGNNSLKLPLPKETTHKWEWIDPMNQSVKEILASDDRAQLDSAPQQLLEGWLRMLPYEKENQKQ